jgi:photosystem II stability/assembly factor-like uncharacterized protein
MVGTHLGWAVGAGGVYATRDGVHWSIQFRSPEPLAGVDFIDGDTGWAVGLQRLYRTLDGGAHWSPTPATAAPLRNVHFASRSMGWGIAGGGDLAAAHGWLVPGSGASLTATVDGGLTWSALPAPANPQTVCFTSATGGWLGARDGVYRSTDGGQTWRLALRRTDYSPNAYGQVTLIECSGPVALWVYVQGGFAATSHLPYAAYSSIDGRDWRLVFDESFFPDVPQTAPGGPDSYPGSFSVVDPDDAVFVGDGPATMRAPVVAASQGGAVLDRRGTIGDAWWTAGASFTSMSTGWVVAGLNAGNAMAVYATVDGGARWSRQLVVPIPPSE